MAHIDNQDVHMTLREKLTTFVTQSQLDEERKLTQAKLDLIIKFLSLDNPREIDRLKLEMGLQEQPNN